ncbi:hypothetical protein ACOSQ2_019758 [Xanthoceras sorbifolium]
MAQADFHKSKKGTMWFLDSGCNNHMTGDRQWFLYLDESFRQVVKLDNNTKMAIMGKGIFYCPELQNNLFSIVLACFKPTFEDQIDLWHRRFGHLNFKFLRTLSYKKMVKGMPHLNGISAVCTICMVGKQHQETIPKKNL